MIRVCMTEWPSLRLTHGPKLTMMRSPASVPPYISELFTITSPNASSAPSVSPHLRSTKISTFLLFLVVPEMRRIALQLSLTTAASLYTSILYSTNTHRVFLRKKNHRNCKKKRKYLSSQPTKRLVGLLGTAHSPADYVFPSFHY
eukprot:TRINITY_DN78270_c0_g1_i1.p1 TRINITY_DN78270_c0_g1~~TRINITY_DN78270_c0_g1_i1.p1  ORF type:complete len:145 (+),score=2.32 TRINITY_DN78270_c0_g1_i1:264-698(+)